MKPIGNINQFNEEKVKELFMNDRALLETFIRESPDNLPPWFCRFIFNFLANLELSDSDSQYHYYQMISHWTDLSNTLKREINLRVAILDYFLLNLPDMIKNPKILEISTFEEILKRSMEDLKTGCYNSNSLNEIAKREINRARRYDQKVSFILIDIDNFKGINDNLGHLYGDKVLRAFSKTIKMTVRKEDLVARFGGDEFVVILPQTSKAGALYLGDRIKQSIHKAFTLEPYLSKDIRISFSAGIVTFPADGMEFEELLGKADTALYQAKESGRNRIVDYKILTERRDL